MVNLAEEYSNLIKSLDRDGDEHVFAYDVKEKFPELFPAYGEICPHRMDLQTMNNKVAMYCDAGQAGLTLIEADVNLIADNCLRFNRAVPWWCEKAENFRKYAHDAIASARQRLFSDAGGRGKRRGGKREREPSLPPAVAEATVEKIALRHREKAKERSPSAVPLKIPWCFGTN